MTEYFYTRWYLVNSKQKLVLQKPFNSITEANRYRQGKPALNDYRIIMKGADVIKMLGAQELREVSIGGVEASKNGAVPMTGYQFLPESVRKRLPPLYACEEQKDPIVQVKFFTPWSNWTWYGYEFDGEDLFFGWVMGLENELGYFSLSELQSLRGPMGLKIERDIHFDPKPLSQVMESYGESLPMTIPKRKPRELPKFRGYTVDYRLSEFRKLEYGKVVEFIPFDSLKGKDLLTEMERANDALEQKICDKWNAQHPVGTKVIFTDYWDKKHTGTTGEPARVVYGKAVVWLKEPTLAARYELERIQAINP